MQSGKIEPPDGEPAAIRSLYTNLILKELEHILKHTLMHSCEVFGNKGRAEGPVNLQPSAFSVQLA